MPDDVPSEERVRVALDEVLGWQGLSRSPQLADLLRYVVEKTLAGDSGGIKAYSIAVDVFGRPTEFDPQTDPIVRVQARRLRSLLEQFYSSGLSRSGVEIQLPLGRYVPEFVVTGSVAEQPSTTAPGAPAPPPGDPKRQFVSPSMSTALLALIFMLVGVVLTIALVRWMLPQFQSEPSVPTHPGIVVGAFDNLTGQPVLDDDVAQVADRLREGLNRFEDLRVGQQGFEVGGTVQAVKGRLVLRANLLQKSTLAWTATVEGPTGQSDIDALRIVTLQLAEQLGNATGPLHAPGRSWLKLQSKLSEPVSEYVCDLVYMRWRESRDLKDAENSQWCFASLLRQSPNLPMALAGNADVSSWRKRHTATPSDDLSQLLSEEAALAGRAVTLSPASSFVYEQQAMVLARQGSLDAAMGAIRKALELNPANLDAVAVNGYLLWTAGEYGQGASNAERALSGVQSPPPWYYLTRALNALREDRFFDAIDAAQGLAAGHDELGPIIALTAAPRAARVDLIDRYRPMVLGNVRFQEVGIMPRIGMRIRAQGVLQRIRSGLVLAGLPANALDRPFNPDGSEKLPG